MPNFQISPKPLEVYASVEEQFTLVARGDRIYYGLTARVSSASYDGFLDDGDTLELESTKWFVTIADKGGGFPGSGALIEIDAEEPIPSRLLSYASLRADLPLNAKTDFRALGAGDDYSAELKNALAEARGAGRPLYIPEGVYGVSATLTSGETSPLVLQGAGKGRTVLLTSLLSSPVASVVNSGRVSQGVTTSDIARGATTFLIADTSGLTKNDLVLLRDTISAGLDGGDDTDGGARAGTAALAGQTVRVKSVDSATQVTIYGAFNWNLVTGTSVLKLTNSSGHRISDLTVKNANPGTVTSLGGNSNMRAFSFNQCEDVRVDRCSTYYMDGASFYLLNCYNAHLHQIDGYFGQDYEDTTIHPYLVAFGQASQYCSISNSTQDYGRHLITTTPTSTEVATQQIKVSDCFATHMRNSPFDNHPGTRFMYFSDCHTSACASGGFALRGPDCQIVGGQVDGCARGVQLFYGADRALVSQLGIFNCDIGIQNTASDDMMVRDVRIDKPRTYGIFYQDQGASWPDYVQTGDIDDVLITGTPATAGIGFFSGVHKPGIKIGPRVRIPGAVTGVSGLSTALTAAATLTVPA